jgi:Uma2 family endonuclease
MEASMSVVVEGRTLLTYSDYVLFPEDGKRHEIVGGLHYVTPSPITRHQRISRWILLQLMEQIEAPGLGEVFCAPLDLVLSDVDVVQPDLLVVLKENRRIIKRKNVQGAPNLVVEITSPSTKKRDMDLKKSLYQSHGIPEYWVVLADEDVVEKFVLHKGIYRSAGRFRDKIGFESLQGVVVDLKKVW